MFGTWVIMATSILSETCDGQKEISQVLITS